MKPAASTIVNSGNLGGVSKTMTIQHDAMAHIMSVLTNLYSDAVLAVIREYATNAIDAHRESGFTGPIHVTAPSTLKPTFTVEDFGVGMSTDTLLDLYSSYGASTKRGTNEQTGMLGLGSKSALAYSTQFTIRSRFGGVETTALVYLNDRGEGEIKVVDTKATDKTGTKIEIPVGPKDIRTFERHISTLFAFWPKSDVTVKGTPIDSGYDTWEWVTDSIALAPQTLGGGYRYSQDAYAVQGGVPYKIDSDSLSDEAKALYQSLPLHNHTLVFIAPIGSLQFTPSREALYYTNATNATLIRLFEDYQAKVGPWVTQKIANAKDKTEALRFYEKHSYLIPDGAIVTWQNETVPASIDCTCFETDTAKRANGRRYRTLPPLSKMSEYDIVIYDVTDNQATDKGSYALRVNASGHLTGAYSLCERYYNNGNKKNVLLIVGDLPDNFDWYGITAVKASDLKPKVAKVKGVKQADKEYVDREWVVVDENAGYADTVKIDPSDPKVCYVDAKQRWEMRKHPADWTVVMVPGNQHGRFARAFPLAKTPQQVRDSVVVQSNIVLDEAASTYRMSNISDCIKRADVSEILDPDLARVVSWIKHEPDSIKQADKIRADYAWLKIDVSVAAGETPTLNIVQRRYKGLLSNWMIDKNQTLDVLNALYLYKFQGGTK